MGKDSRKDSMPSERMRLLWTFLDTVMFDKALTCIASDFQPHALHPEEDTTLLVKTISGGLTGHGLTHEEECLKLIKALRDNGASWTQACRSSREHTIWKNADPEKTKLTVTIRTQSALSFAQAWLRQLHDKEEWKLNVFFLQKVFKIFLDESQPPRTKLAIDEDIVSKLRRSQVFSLIFLLLTSRMILNRKSLASVPST